MVTPRKHLLLNRRGRNAIRSLRASSPVVDCSGRSAFSKRSRRARATTASGASRLAYWARELGTTGRT
ncbi:MAG: hypothetical protein ACRDRW_02975 [Pseudonocardiaceae bacterium]